MNKLFSLFLFLLFTITSSASFPIEATDHKVIVFAGEHCSSNCYNANSKKRSCMWFKTDNNLPMSFSDLSRYSDSYTVDITRSARGEEFTIGSKTYSFTWESDIHRIYIGNDYTKVILYPEKNFSGRGIEVWGRGCIDLDRYGWANRAQSMKIVSRY